MNQHLCLRALLVLTVASMAGPALAHVPAQPNEGATGGTFRTAFNVPHGCEGSPTVAVRLKIPEGVTGVKPQLKPGWQITLKMRKVQSPMEAGKPADAGHIQMDQHGT